VTVERKHQDLIRRIGSAVRAWRRRAALAGVTRALTVIVPTAALVIFLEAVVALSPPVRAALLLALGALTSVAAGFWIVRPMARRVDVVGAAARIEERYPQLGERLESSTELWVKRGMGRHGYSIELIDGLIEMTVAEAAGLDFSGAHGERGGRRRAIGLVLAVAASVGALVPVSGAVGPAVGRLTHPAVAASAPVVVLTVAPGDTTLVSGDALDVVARISGPGSHEPVLRVTAAGEEPVETAMEFSAGAGGFGATVDDVRSDLAYSVEAGRLASDLYLVEVVERPYVTGIRLDLTYPSYTGLPARTVDENNGDITAVKGTSVRVTMTASKPLREAGIVFEGGERLPLEQLGPATFAGDLRVGANSSYRFEITDADGLSSPAPPRYSIVALRDEYPLVRIIEPGEDGEVPRQMTLPLVVSAIDDHGVREARIRYSIEGLADETLVPLGRFGAGGQREVVLEREWDLSETGILPGAVLVYFAEVVDTDDVSGPKVARSESYLLRFPTMAELYHEVAGEQDELVSDLDELVEEQEDVRREFEELEDEILSDPALDWRDEEKVEQAVERQQEIVHDVEELADRVAELTEKMSESDRIALDTLDKMQEITELLDEVATDDMRDLMADIRQAMERISPEQISRAMEETSVTQEDYLRRLEHTVNLLKRVKAEQQLADAADRARRLADEEERIAEEAERSPGPSRCDDLAERQESVTARTRQLESDLREATRSMQEIDPDAAREIEQAASDMEKAGTVGKMQQAKQSLTDRRPSEAAASCEDAASDLKSLFTRLSSCQGGMACSLQRRDSAAVLRAVEELLAVSDDQEEIVLAVEGRRRIPRDELVSLVAKQADLAESLEGVAERLFRVSDDSFVIDMKTYQKIGVVQAAMTRAVARIADGGTAAGRKEAGAALGALNSVIVDLLTSNQKGAGGGQGSALEELMQQLRRMAEQQSQLNDMTEEVQRQLEELGMSSSIRQQLAEMRAHQERLAEEARRLAEEFGGRREILGRLDDLADEMSEALEELGRTGASDETIERQKRILSRLLDAQRSLRRRDYTRERRSRTGTAPAASGPGALPEDLARAREELREDLLRAMQREYPQEYRETIRAYFEALAGDVAGEGGSEGSR